MKKTSLAAMLAAALLLTACGAPADTTSSEVSSPETSSDIPSDASEQSPEPAPETADISFTAGLWESENAYFTFYDGNSGNVIYKDTEMGVGFEYEVDGANVTFHMGAVDDNTPATAEQTSSGDILLTWEDGSTDTLTFVPDKTVDDFLSDSGSFAGFAEGEWVSDANTYTFYDEKSGNVVGNESGTGVGFEYEIDGSTVTFHMGAVDNNTPATAEQTDENTVVLTWEDGRVETLTFSASV